MLIVARLTERGSRGAGEQKNRMVEWQNLYWSGVIEVVDNQEKDSLFFFQRL
jgi:hypothetical protein